MNTDRPIRILIVDDDPGHLITLKTLIGSWGYFAETADDGDTAIEQVKAGSFDLVLMDIRMARMGGIEALAEIKAYNPTIPVIIMTAYSSVESAIDALKGGAYDYLMKPLDFDVLKLTIERAGEHAGLEAENERLREQLGADLDAPNIIGNSRAMKSLMEMLAMVAPSDTTVLISGESGTGKELIARSLHHNSPRRDHPLVIVNCAALSEPLLESELFGHEKGAFTGADKRHEGRFMQAHRGTMFLDEIGETSPAMQAKLLRVLEQKEIQRVGGEKTHQVDVRIVAATNRDLEAEVSRGRFREDLFYRLNVMPLDVPPLRERRGDIPLLADHFLKKYAAKNRKAVKGFSPMAMNMFIKYDWPGNVRELENVVERAVILLTGEHITEKQLPLNMVNAGGEANAPASAAMNGERSLEDVEKEAIQATLEATAGNKSESARRLGITRKTLHNKLKRYGIR